MKPIYGSDQLLGELHVCAVTDFDAVPLGWSVCVLISSEQHIEMLVLRHCDYQAEAFSIKQGVLNFLQREPQLVARLSWPREFWEWLVSTRASAGDKWWTTLNEDELSAIVSDKGFVRCTREEWYPNSPDSLTRWLDKYIGLDD